VIRDEDLQSSVDYSAGQKEAAYKVLVELMNLFGKYKDDILIIGGWVPELMSPKEGHIGSVDVDVLINHLTLREAGYQTMEKLLLKSGYKKHPQKYFSFLKRVTIDNIQYNVDVDILAGQYGGTQEHKNSQHVQGIKALKATSGHFAFDFKPQHIKVEAKRPDGAIDVAQVNVIAVVPYLVMKTAALGRGKAKDAYDIYFLIKHYHGGAEQLAREFSTCSGKPIVLNMKEKLSEKFASEKHSGPVDVSNFMDLVDEEEIEMIRRDAYEQIQALLSMI